MEEALTQWFNGEGAAEKLRDGPATSPTSPTGAAQTTDGTSGSGSRSTPADAVIERPTQTQPDVFAELAARDKVGIGGTIEESHDEDGVRVIDKIKLVEVSIVKDSPENRAAGAGHVISSPADVEQFVRPIRPVPKPTSTKRPSRRKTTNEQQGTRLGQDPD